jgi:hypothetical protein
MFNSAEHSGTERGPFVFLSWPATATTTKITVFLSPGRLLVLVK